MKVVRYRILIFGPGTWGTFLQDGHVNLSKRTSAAGPPGVRSRSSLIMTTPLGIPTLLADSIQSHASGAYTTLSAYAG